MSIDARVAGVCYHLSDHTTNLVLFPRDEKIGPAGQQMLTVKNEFVSDSWERLRVLVGLEVWGGSGFLMLGDKKIADRIGYTSIRLVDGWEEIARDLIKESLK